MFDLWQPKIEVEPRRNSSGFLHPKLSVHQNRGDAAISARITETSSSKYNLMEMDGSLTGDEGGFDRQRFDFEGCPDQ